MPFDLYDVRQTERKIFRSRPPCARARSTKIYPLRAPTDGTISSSTPASVSQTWQWRITSAKIAPREILSKRVIRGPLYVAYEHRELFLNSLARSDAVLPLTNLFGLILLTLLQRRLYHPHLDFKGRCCIVLFSHLIIYFVIILIYVSFHYLFLRGKTRPSAVVTHLVVTHLSHNCCRLALPFVRWILMSTIVKILCTFYYADTPRRETWFGITERDQRLREENNGLLRYADHV